MQDTRKPARPTQTVVEHTCRRRIRRAEHVLLRIGGQLPVLGFTLPERAVQHGIFRTESIKGTVMRAWLSSMGAARITAERRVSHNVRTG